MSNDKYKALRDALKTTEFPCGEMIRSLLTDHDRMRAALKRTEFCWECGAHGAAIKTLRKCEQ